jgi:hypothetical protein
MPWSPKQKQLAARACIAAGIDDHVRRDVILRNFCRAWHNGKITSTAPRLSNQDFAHFMSIVERYAGGRILHFTAGYWEAAATDVLHRLRYRAQKLALALEAKGKLAPDGVGLSGWIKKRVSGGEVNRLVDLDYHGLVALILQLEAYTRQRPASPSVLSGVPAPRTPPGPTAGAAGAGTITETTTPAGSVADAGNRSTILQLA